MDLNEKLAARRRELAIAAEQEKQLERERSKKLEAVQQRLAIEAESAKRAEREAAKVEADKRLAKMGIAPVGTTDAHTEPADVKPINPKMIEAEVQKGIDKAARDRLTSGENAAFFFLLAMGLLGFFIAWWLGLFFIVWASVYISKATDRHKEKIIAEGKLKQQEAGYSAGTPHKSHPNVVWDGTGHLVPAEGYTWSGEKNDYAVELKGSVSPDTK